jgi:hypothetical protein
MRYALVLPVLVLGACGFNANTRQSGAAQLTIPGPYATVAQPVASPEPLPQPPAAASAPQPSAHPYPYPGDNCERLVEPRGFGVCKNLDGYDAQNYRFIQPSEQQKYAQQTQPQEPPDPPPPEQSGQGWGDPRHYAHYERRGPHWNGSRPDPNYGSATVSKPYPGYRVEPPSSPYDSHMTVMKTPDGQIIMQTEQRGCIVNKTIASYAISLPDCSNNSPIILVAPDKLQKVLPPGVGAPPTNDAPVTSSASVATEQK